VISKYRLRRRVRFYETDAAGIVHFSWFYRYMEEAEHALWREAGLSIARDITEFGFPRLSASFDFHQPLQFEDEFDIDLVISKITKKTIHYNVHIMKGKTLIATGSMVIACVKKYPGKPMKAVPIPKDIIKFFQIATPASPSKNK